MKFGNEFWLILFREYISPNLFAVHRTTRYCKGHKSYPMVAVLAIRADVGRVKPSNYTAVFIQYRRK